MPPTADADPPVDRSGHADQAVRLYHSLRDGFALPGRSHLYREAAGSDAYAYLWPFSQVLAATADLAILQPEFGSDVAALLTTALPRYRAGGRGRVYASSVGRPWSAGGERFYDDNAWIGLALVRAGHLLGDEMWIDQAAEVFAHVVGGWDDDPDHPLPGGIFWTESHTNRDRNTVSNAPVVELGVRLFQAKADPWFRDWALCLYRWVEASMRDPADGLFWDHVDLSGVVDTTKWTYNQGTMVGAGVLLHEVSGDADALSVAEHLAAASLRHFAEVGWSAQDPAFNAIFVRNLLYLMTASKDAGLARAIEAAADRYTAQVRDDHGDADGGFFSSAGRPAKVIDHAALVQIHACLALAPPQRRLLL